MSGHVTAILLSAGGSSRMGFDKLTLSFGGRTALEYSLLAFLSAGVKDIIITVSVATRTLAEALADRHSQEGVSICLVEGGTSRGDSVYNALIKANGEIVAIHDAARCLVGLDTIMDSIAGAVANGSGVAAVLPRDTIWQANEVLNRDALLSAQTPQSFYRLRILEAYEAARKNGIIATDDAALYNLHWGEVHFTKGSPLNHKLTTQEDIPLFEALLGQRRTRTGFGEDTHRLVQGRALILGGADIPFELGLLGHSDADVLTHAVVDSILGAAALGDIGSHFPDTDPRYKGICSLELLGQVNNLLREKGFYLGNLDATIVAERPKLAPYIQQMRQNLARALCCGIERISIKATTTEGCGPEGELICITARCVCSLEEYNL